MHFTKMGAPILESDSHVVPEKMKQISHSEWPSLWVLLCLAFACTLQCGCRALIVDPDGDGLTDGYESICKTSPSLRDSDGNGIPDGTEDPDGDGLTNLQEQQFCTDPFMKDEDGEGYFPEFEDNLTIDGTTTDSTLSTEGAPSVEK